MMSHSTPPSRQRAARRAGFTMVELGLAMTVLLVALMAMSASTLRMHSLRRQNRERTLAQNAVRAVSEQIHSVSYLAKNEPGTWSQVVTEALAAGGTPGPSFNVRELNAQEGVLTVGDIVVVTDETLTDAALGFELGLPRDLDGDGLVNNTDVSATARILPVVVRARWTGATGDVTIAHPFYVMGY